MLLWAAVQRNDVVLAEADLVEQQDISPTNKTNLAKLAHRILRKKPSPGWEHAKNANLKAAKLHLHQRLPPPPTAPTGTPHRHLIWSYSCVYANAFDEKLAKGFLEKLALMTDPLRETHDWLHGPALVAQDTFAPTLLQRMEQANSTGKTALISAKVNEVREIVRMPTPNSSIFSHAALTPVPSVAFTDVRQH